MFDDSDDDSRAATPRDKGKRRRVDDSGIVATPAQAGGVDFSFNDSGAASASPFSLTMPDDHDSFDFESLRRQRDTERRAREEARSRDVAFICPYKGESNRDHQVPPIQRSQKKSFEEIFSGNLVLGENHGDKSCKLAVQALTAGDGPYIFIMEQVPGDLQDDLDRLLEGESMDDLPKLKALIKRISDGHDSDFMPMFKSFCGKGASGFRLIALDRANFDYGKGGSRGEPRIVGMNKDCESIVRDLLDKEDGSADLIKQGKCVVFCGNGHISRRVEHFEPGIPARLNNLLRAKFGDSLPPRALFQGVHFRDIVGASEIAAIFTEESVISCGEEETHVLCVAGANPKIKDGIINAIARRPGAKFPPIINDAKEVDFLLKKDREDLEHEVESPVGAPAAGVNEGEARRLLDALVRGEGAPAKK